MLEKEEVGQIIQRMIKKGKAKAKIIIYKNKAIDFYLVD